MTPEEFLSNLIPPSPLRKLTSDAAIETHSRLQQLEKDVQFLRDAVQKTQSDSTFLAGRILKLEDKFKPIFPLLISKPAIPAAKAKATHKRVKPKRLRRGNARQR